MANQKMNAQLVAGIILTAAAFLVILLVYVDWFLQPSMTYMQAMVHYWPQWALAIAFMLVGYCAVSDQ